MEVNEFESNRAHLLFRKIFLLVKIKCCGKRDIHGNKNLCIKNLVTSNMINQIFCDKRLTAGGG